MNVEIEVDQLADFLFRKNANDVVVELSLGGIEDNKDLFYFCLDLFCKGLVMLFGKDNRLIVNDITLDQFDIVRKKMGNAGVNVTLQVINEDPMDDVNTSQCDFDDAPTDLDESTLYPRVNMKDIESMPSDLPLKSYAFEINLKSNLAYLIHFDLVHKVA